MKEEKYFDVGLKLGVALIKTIVYPHMDTLTLEFMSQKYHYHPQPINQDSECMIRFCNAMVGEY